MMKTCSRCGEEKPTEGFPRHKTSKDGIRAACKECVAADNRRRYLASRDSVLAKQRAYNARPEVRARDKVVKADYYRANRDRIRQRSRQWAADNPEALAARRRKDYDTSRDALNALKAHPCTDCGKQYPSPAMHFDHVRGEKKRFHIIVSNMRRPDLGEELAKCELRCANCHAIRHYNERATSCER